MTTKHTTKKTNHYTYADCLRDAAPAPTGINGTTLYQLLMVGGTVALVVTAGSIRDSGSDFLKQPHWMYPLIFCIAFLARVYISGPLVAFLAPRLIGSRLRGFARGAAMTVLGVCVASPITSAIVALLFTEPDDFLGSYVHALATTTPMTMLISHFIVGPAVKLAFHNRITPDRGLKTLEVLDQHALSFLKLFGM